MYAQLIPSTWQAILNHFFPIFTVPTTKIFAALASGWVLCTARRTVTGMIRFAELFTGRSHDAFHRFFSRAPWSVAELWRLLAILLIQTFYPTGTIPLDLDDTLFHKSGKKVSGASTWRDPVRSEKWTVFARGLNLTVLTLRVCPPWGGEPIGLPVNMRLRFKEGPSHIDLAESVIVEIASWFPNRRFLCHCDGFYTALIDRDLPRTHLITRMRKDAIIFDLPPQTKPKRGRRRIRGRVLQKPIALAKTVKYRLATTLERSKKRKRLLWAKQVIWYHVSKKTILLVISRDPTGKEKDNFFVTTDLTLKPVQVVSQYAGRWSIEETFKNTKQLLGGQQPQSFKREGPQRAAAMSFWLYSTVWLWYIKNKRLWNRLPQWHWYRQKTTPSFADVLACLRQQLWKERINCMFDSHLGFEKIPKSVIIALAYAA